jgi:hypothetical protein
MCAETIMIKRTNCSTFRRLSNMSVRRVGFILWVEYFWHVRIFLFNLSEFAVGIATGYALDDLEAGVRVPVGSKSSLLNVVQTGSGVHRTSYTVGTGGSFPGVKRPVREADHSPPTSAEVKKMWIYTSTPPYAFMA